MSDASAWAGTGAGLLLLLLFAAGWRLIRGQEKDIRRTDIWNALGFGLFPAAAAAKAFEQYTWLGEGRLVPEPLPWLPWVTGNGRYMPCRIELILFLCSFLLLCLWLMQRREMILIGKEVLLTALTCWACIRGATEGLRAGTLLPEFPWAVQAAACGTGLVCLACWSAEMARAPGNRNQIMINWVTVIAADIVLMLTAAGIVDAGSEIGNLAAAAGCSALSMLLILLAGRDSRRAGQLKSE